MKTGDLILIKSQKEFDDSITSFYDKCGMATARSAMVTRTAMGIPTAMAMALATSPTRVAVTITNKKTNETIKLKYHGYEWKYITFPFIGIITEVIPEEVHDFDIFKIYHDNQYFYCRRSIIEGTMK